MDLSLTKGVLPPAFPRLSGAFPYSFPPQTALSQISKSSPSSSRTTLPSPQVADPARAASDYGIAPDDFAARARSDAGGCRGVVRPVDRYSKTTI